MSSMCNTRQRRQGGRDAEPGGTTDSQPSMMMQNAASWLLPARLLMRALLLGQVASYVEETEILSEGLKGITAKHQVQQRRGLRHTWERGASGWNAKAAPVCKLRLAGWTQLRAGRVFDRPSSTGGRE
jgi:hypothetical protein